MIPLQQFVDEHKEAVADNWQEAFEDAIQTVGLEKFRDLSEMQDECHQLTSEAFGLSVNACWDEEGIFDIAADYCFGLADAAETIMLQRAFPGLAPFKPSRRAEEVLFECAELMQKKGAAYNGFPQAEYYPYGLRDIWYMTFTKVKRLESQIVRDGEANFEGVEDSARDLINYAAFLIEFAEGKMNGQQKEESD